MLNSEEDFKVGFSSLERGQLYPIVQIEKTESKFYGKTVSGMKVNVLDGDLKLVTYLPKEMVDAIKDADFDEIAYAARTNEKFTVCYYGKMQNSQTTTFIGRVHRPGEGR